MTAERVMGSDATRAVGRFLHGGVSGYRAATIADRASLVERNIFLYQRSQPHWFVPDGETGDYCEACNTPRQNARHCERK